MKAPTRPHLLAVVLLSATVASGLVFGQGSLIPPGAPMPLMKTLDQVEARMPIDAVHTPGDAANQWIINQPGSYYLTGNITGVSGRSGIKVTANNVSIDLNGFAVIGVPGSLYGITVPGSTITNLSVRNGTVRDWGSEGLSAYYASNSRFKDVQTSGNGVWGIVIGFGGNIESCQALSNGALSMTAGGIYARFGSRVLNCVVEGNTTHGIFSEDGCNISGCTAEDTALGGASTGQGLVTGNGSSVTGCTVRSNAGTGIAVPGECLISNCAVSNNNGTGITTSSNCIVSACNVSRNQLNGVVLGAGCTISDCDVSFNTGGADIAGLPAAYGIYAAAGSTVRNCTLSSNSKVTGAIFSEADCQIVGNTCNANGLNTTPSAGIWAAGGRVESNMSNNQSFGYLNANASGAVYFTRNVAHGNTIAFFCEICPGVAPIINLNATPFTFSPLPMANYVY